MRDPAAAQHPRALGRVKDAGLAGADALFGVQKLDLGALRAGGAWCDAPLIALSSRAERADVARGREAGFTDYVAKYDREALLRSLADCLSAPLAA